MRTGAWFACVGSWLLLASCGGSRDVVIESRDVRTDTAQEGTAAAVNGGYEYVARRPLGAVALAEGRGLSKDVAERATNVVADALQRCAADLAQQGKLVQGAARVVARIGNDGSLAGIHVKIAPGAAVAANAILCFIAPIKSLTFAPIAEPTTAAQSQRGIALEAEWNVP